MACFDKLNPKGEKKNPICLIRKKRLKKFDVLKKHIYIYSGLNFERQLRGGGDAVRERGMNGCQREE